jgi:hypothetical protein
MAEAIFWGAIGIIAYVYAGFPLFVFLLAQARPRPVRKGPAPLPTVSFIIAAYNEEGSIAKKLANTFALDYPADRLEIIVVSDGSSDRTEAIVRAEGRNRVKLVALRGRNGKTIAQNRAVEAATGEIVVFSTRRRCTSRAASAPSSRTSATPRSGASRDGSSWAPTRTRRCRRDARPTPTTTSGSGAARARCTRSSAPRAASRRSVGSSTGHCHRTSTRTSPRRSR